MAYATPARVIQEFGLTEVTQLLADEEQLLTGQLLLDALAVQGTGFWTGEPSEAERSAASAAAAKLVRKLETTSNMMDGYLRSAVQLPLAAQDANAGTLEECCCALVRCGLADDTDNATERMDKCCDTWRTWLKDVGKGVVQLVGSTGEPVATNAKSGARTGQAATGFDWGRHAGWTQGNSFGMWP